MKTSNSNYKIERAAFSKTSELNFHHDCLTSLPESIGSLIDLTKLYLSYNRLTCLPENIGNLANLTHLYINNNQLASLPESIGNLSSLTHLHLYNNQLTHLPESICRLSSLTHLYLDDNYLSSLPESIGNLINLEFLGVDYNQLTCLPKSIGNLSRLTDLYLCKNKLTTLPKSIGSLSNLKRIQLNLNPLTDLSGLYGLSEMVDVQFFALVNLPRRYWKQIDKWNPEWLLDENNAEIRRTLVEHIGYEKICKELQASQIDSWREYTLLQIGWIKPIVLLKMTCPSTGHIHILRVPPQMMSAEEAITWVNHGIHPDRFAVQT